MWRNAPSLAACRDPWITRHALLIRREEKHHRSVGELRQQRFGARWLHGRAPLTAARTSRRHIWCAMHDHSARLRIVVETRGQAKELETDGAVRLAAGFSM